MKTKSDRGVPDGNAPLMKPKEACGVFALSLESNHDVKTILYSGLRALQHRGEDGAGIAFQSQSKSCIDVVKSVGLVEELFGLHVLPETQLSTSSAIGHVRYGTQGGNDLQYVQPYSLDDGSTAVAFNGQIDAGDCFSDSQLLYDRFKAFLRSEDSLKACAKELTLAKSNEAFSAVALDGERIYAFRDCYGTRPLFMCNFLYEDSMGLAVASETCAFNHLDARDIQEVMPGSVVVIEKGVILSVCGHGGFNASGSQALEVADKEIQKRFCAFEALYFSREDSLFESQTYYDVRKGFGRALARLNKESDTNVEVVIGVPQSGMPAAFGYSEESGIRLELGLIKNRYTGRSFIQSSESKRQNMIEEKLQVQPSAVKDKSVIVVDDTIVRGHTMKRIVGILRQAGAREVHVRIAAPPILSPCTKGVDTGRETKLPAAELQYTELEALIGSDSLSFLSLGRLKVELGESICDDCFI